MPNALHESPAENGRAPAALDDEQIVAAIRVQVDALEAQRAELQAQLDEITPQLRRYEKAMLAILGEPLRKEAAIPRPASSCHARSLGPKLRRRAR